jgi:hypothetical protein
MQSSQYFATFDHDNRIVHHGKIVDLQENGLHLVEVSEWQPFQGERLCQLDLSGDNVSFYESKDELETAIDMAINA